MSFNACTFSVWKIINFVLLFRLLNWTLMKWLNLHQHVTKINFWEKQFHEFFQCFFLFLGRKPYDSLSNPYPTSCSRLCNHPVSKEVKKEYHEVLKQTKDTHVNYTNFWKNNFTKFFKLFFIIFLGRNRKNYFVTRRGGSCYQWRT